MTTEVRCSTCAYFQPSDAHSERPGECRRHPPLANRHWPATLADDWCGDFRRAGDWPVMTPPRAPAAPRPT